MRATAGPYPLLRCGSEIQGSGSYHEGMGAPRCFLALVLAIPLTAGEFWDSKPYTQWTDDEVTRVLVDSPWAKDVFIRFEGEFDARFRAQQQAPPPPPANPSQAGRSTDGGPLGSMVGRKGQPIPAGATVGVRWESAKPLRQAVAVTKKTPVAPEPGHYAIVIDRIPPYMESREPANLRDVLLQITELKWGKEAPVHPIDAMISANADGLVVRLHFPRRPGVKPSESVELHTRIGVSRVRCSFQVRRMTMSGQLEL
jgi:hypothetical protein